ncbi:hypothetical protein, conserved [Plasmodium gonderi]|uniref:NAD(P)H-hydrate epimerase n=1 Tax=Plasmodium gonderi TaxID=77519 RepID=A0A1Y1JJ11_PLAGO|nr:hypothetical protein, conserved [Plasmodium gonderi]GAW82489.1 hypothetical protein, conserved [Plasmodium gonderi]
MKKDLSLRAANQFMSRNSIYFLGFLNIIKFQLTNRISINTTKIFERKNNHSNTCDLNSNKMEVSYLSQSLAQKIDNELMSENVGYTTEQLIELAGLSIAQIIYKEYNFNQFKKVLIICGPGNNGGDGLVTARHLKHFGYEVRVVYPKENNKILFKKLLKLLEHYHVDVMKSTKIEEVKNYDLVVDALFGFSFKGEPRNPFDEIIKMINESKVPVVSVDVPSGTNVDNGNTTNGLSVNSEMNISLMLPKEGVRNYRKKHYLGGRFIPSSIVEKYNLKVPLFPGDSSYVKL